METRGAFHNSIQQKFRFEISEIPRAYWNGTFRLHSPDPSRIQKRGTGDNNFVKYNGKGHFSPTDRDNRTGQSGPPSRLVPNIPIGPNRNGPFHSVVHLMYQPKFPEFWVEWKAPYMSFTLDEINRFLGDRYEFLVISCGHSTDFKKKKFWEGHTTDIGSQFFHAHLKFLADQRDVFFFYLAVISYSNSTFKVRTGEHVDDSCPKNFF